MSNDTQPKRFEPGSTAWAVLANSYVAAVRIDAGSGNDGLYGLYYATHPTTGQHVLTSHEVYATKAEALERLITVAEGIADLSRAQLEMERAKQSQSSALAA